MATKIKAVETIIEWDAELGRMAILNPGDEAEVGDNLAAAKIDAKVATLVKAKANTSPVPAPTPAPAAVAPPADDERIAARARYAEVTGKKPFAGWTTDQLNEKIAGFEAEAAAAAEDKAKAEAEAAAAETGNGEGEGQSEGGAGDGEEGAPA